MKPERDAEPEDEELKTIKVQLVGAEKTFQRMLEKRNHLNDAAREARAARDAINDQKRHIIAQIQELKGQRDALNTEARAHRDKRNALQAQAKELIAVKQRARSGGGQGYAGKVRELEGQIKALEFQQQSTVMPIAKENALLKKLGELQKELAVARVQYADEAKLLAEVKDLDAKITELFKEADTEHASAVDISNKAQELHNKIEPLVKDLHFLDQQSDQKHQAFLEARAAADEIHAKMNDAREKVVDLRGARTAVHHERRQIIEDQNRNARAALFDESKLDAAADEAVKLLLSKKKLQL